MTSSSHYKTKLQPLPDVLQCNFCSITTAHMEVHARTVAAVAAAISFSGSCCPAPPTWREVQPCIAVQPRLLGQDIHSFQQLWNVAGLDLSSSGLPCWQPTAPPCQLSRLQARHDRADAVWPLWVHAAAALLMQLHALIPAEDCERIALQTCAAGSK
jgi:hypothetical protein